MIAGRGPLAVEGSLTISFGFDYDGPTATEARKAFEALPRDIDRETWWAAYRTWTDAADAERAQKCWPQWLALFAPESEAAS